MITNNKVRTTYFINMSVLRYSEPKLNNWQILFNLYISRETRMTVVKQLWSDGEILFSVLNFLQNQMYKRWTNSNIEPEKIKALMSNNVKNIKWYLTTFSHLRLIYTVANTRNAGITEMTTLTSVNVILLRWRSLSHVGVQLL
jgi:hypothetical protein